MIKSIINKILKKKADYIEDLTTLEPKKPEYKASHRGDVDGFKGKRVQADLLYLPTDPKKYKYLLVVVDNYSAKTDAEPLKKRDAISIIKALDKILKRQIIGKKVYIIQVDNGSEFKKGLDDYLKNKGIILRTASTNRHSQQAMVEARNKTFGSSIMKIQLANEIENNEQDTSWVYLIKPILKEINKQVKPIKLKRTNKVLCVKDSDCKLYDIGDKMYYKLDYPIDFKGKRIGSKFRAGDVRYSRSPVKIENILLLPDRPVRYILEGITNRTFSKNQLKPELFKVEKIIGEKGNKYLIKWLGYSNADNTYESKKKMKEDIPKLVLEYENNK